MKYGARNQIDGNVKTIKRGTIMAQAEVDAGGGVTITSVMTLDTLDELGLEEGDRVKAVIKAVNVSLIKE